MKQLLDQRTPVYEGCADYTVDTNGMNADEVARAILNKFEIPVRSEK